MIEVVLSVSGRFYKYCVISAEGSVRPTIILDHTFFVAIDHHSNGIIICHSR